MIVGISSVRNEEAIIAKTATHTLAVGADHLIISDGHSTDETRDILAELENVTALSQDGPFDQIAETLRLAHLAWSMGATWVVPFDADEFWCDLSPLHEAPETTGVVQAAVFGHRNWDWRHEAAKPLPKVCFRPCDGMEVAWGNHDARVDGFTQSGLQIRELQYQSFDHFLAKIEKSAELYATSTFPEVYGSHMRELVAMSDEQRVAEWDRLCAIPAVFDPIPYRGAR